MYVCHLYCGRIKYNHSVRDVITNCILYSVEQTSRNYDKQKMKSSP